MRRGTTPEHIFTLFVDESLIDKIRIRYAQDGKVILTKTEADCQVAGNEIRLRLTQSETLQFREAREVEVEIQVLTTEGQSLRSDIIKVTVKRCLGDEVLE